MRDTFASSTGGSTTRGVRYTWNVPLQHKTAERRGDAKVGEVSALRSCDVVSSGIVNWYHHLQRKIGRQTDETAERDGKITPEEKGGTAIHALTFSSCCSAARLLTSFTPPPFTARDRACFIRWMAAAVFAPAAEGSLSNSSPGKKIRHLTSRGLKSIEGACTCTAIRKKVQCRVSLLEVAAVSDFSSYFHCQIQHDNVQGVCVGYGISCIWVQYFEWSYGVSSSA